MGWTGGGRSDLAALRRGSADYSVQLDPGDEAGWKIRWFAGRAWSGRARPAPRRGTDHLLRLARDEG